VNSRQLLAKRIGLLALTNLLVELNSLIMLPLLTKNLPASEYGVWVQITVTIGLVPAVALLGLPYSMVRFVPPARGREVIQEIFYTMAISNLSGRPCRVIDHLHPGEAHCLCSLRRAGDNCTGPLSSCLSAGISLTMPVGIWNLAIWAKRLRFSSKPAAMRVILISLLRFSFKEAPK